MKAQELRIGNYHLYHIVDKYDERGEYDEVCQIDAEDFRILENFDCPEYRPIPLDEEWLLRFGFKHCPVCVDFENLEMPYYAKDAVLLFFNENRTEYELGDYLAGYGSMRLGKYHVATFKWIKYVHQLQNLYFTLTGEELTINKEL